MHDAADQALGVGRFELLGMLGAGGMGEVYRARDPRSGAAVALKILKRTTGRDIDRFKREFRGIAELHHPQLVTLHELHTTGDEWFFTMELVEGVSFLDWVRPYLAGAGRTMPVTATLSGDDSLAGVVASTAPFVVTTRVRESNLDRLRDALAQLVDGVQALHVCGMLHRDLKPSNVLVTRDGRVVVLDFGLAVDRKKTSLDEAFAVGTPAYMSPEQARGAAVTPATDWYSVGVMLYEALTGARPFEGTNREILQRKQDAPCPDPRAIDPGAPADLAALCMRLLAVDADDRPDGVTVLTALGGSPSRATRELANRGASGPFVGRAREIAAMRDAFADSRRRGVTVLVHGESGIGKSQVLRQFLDEVSGQALVLEGRCYERESVPYRALDRVIDAIATQLVERSEHEIAGLLPNDVSALARLFPVLLRVPAIARAPTPSASPNDLRRRAFDALRELLARFAERIPVIVVIDDLQWGDADSAVFLAELAHPAVPLPILVLLAHRDEDDAGVVARVSAPPPNFPRGDVRSISLGPLSPLEAQQLVEQLGGTAAAAAGLSRETGGHPLFLSELARTTRSEREAPTSLDELIAERVARLPPSAVALLRTAAVAARPLPLAVAARAAGLVGTGSDLPLLRAERLARLRQPMDSDDATLEPYHDRVRAAVVTAMDASALRGVHAQLAQTLEGNLSDGLRDLEALVAHWRGAGELGRAATHALPAARVAESAMAFHRAADLYAMVLEHGNADAHERLAIERSRADALANAGLLVEAAAAYGRASRLSSPTDALEPDRLRMEQLLKAGRMTEGLDAARDLLSRVGLVLPSTRRGVIRAIVVQRLWLRLRGLDFTPTRESDVPPEVLRRIDVIYSVSIGLSTVDPALNMLGQLHLLRAALDAGEPRRACLALMLALGGAGQRGVRNLRRIDDLVRRVRALVAELGDPRLAGLAAMAEGLACMQLGEWQRAKTLLETSIATLRETGTGYQAEAGTSEHFYLTSLFYLGDTRELARTTPIRLRDAIERGNLHLQRGLRGWRSNIAWLILGRPDEARSHVLAAEADRESERQFQLTHYFALASHMRIDLYVGDRRQAWARAERAWDDLEASHVLRVQSLRLEALFLRGTAALAHAIDVGARAGKREIALARRAADQIEREGARWAMGFASQLRATIAILDGDRDQARAQLASAERSYVAHDMALYATAARWRRAVLEATPDAIAAARRTLQDGAVEDPDSLARCVCPWPTDLGA